LSIDEGGVDANSSVAGVMGTELPEELYWSGGEDRPVIRWSSESMTEASSWLTNLGFWNGKLCALDLNWRDGGMDRDVVVAVGEKLDRFRDARKGPSLTL
jgi:hypothetical protein